MVLFLTSDRPSIATILISVILYRVDPSVELFVVFVGDLSPEIDNDTLKEAFSAFGTVTDCRVVTGKSKILAVSLRWVVQRGGGGGWTEGID